MREFIKKLFSLSAPYRVRLVLGVVFGLLSSTVEPLILILISVVGYVVFGVGDPRDLNLVIDRLPDWARPQLESLFAWLTSPDLTGGHGAKIFVIALIPTVALARGVFSYSTVYFMQWVSVRTVADLRVRLFAHLHRLSVSFFSRSTTGDLMSRVFADTIALQHVMASALPVMVKEPFSVIWLVGFLLASNPKLTLFAAVVFPLCVLPVAIFARKVRRSSSAMQNITSEMSTVLHESFTGSRIVKAYNLEKRVVEQFREATRRFISHYMRVVRSQETPGPLIEFLGCLGIALIFIYYAFQPGASPVRFVQFALNIYLLYRPVKSLIRLQTQLEQARAASQRVFELLETKPTVVDPPNPAALRAAGADVCFERLSFQYGEVPVLKDIDLTVKAGQLVALVGKTGSGKTTLTNLLLRFYDPQQGRVLIGGRDVREVALRDLRDQIAVVTQEVVLFNDTIARNIELGRPGASLAEIEAAARHAYAHEFVLAKPDGYNTLIGEKGVALSGGQRQRLAIARAILKNAPILVLDEATSSLDTESERAVQAALEELMKDRTTICIAHRLTTIQKADRIVVLHEGRIVETGTHAELLQAGGLYKKLYDMQFQE